MFPVFPALRDAVGSSTLLFSQYTQRPMNSSADAHPPLHTDSTVFLLLANADAVALFLSVVMSKNHSGVS